MADNRWLGGATDAAMAQTATPGGTIEAGDKFILTIDDTNGNDETLSVDATGTTVAQVCDDIIAAIAALPASSLFKTLVTVADVTTHLTLTATAAGVPFGLVLATTESNDDPADDQTFVAATTVARSGENDWGVAANWSLGAVPVNDDDVWIDELGKDYAILYGLDQSTVTLNSSNVSMAYTGASALIGDGTNYLQISSAAGKTHTIGYQYGGTVTQAGSKRIMIDFGSVATTIHVRGSSSSSQTGEEMKQPIRIKCNSASTVLDLLKGRVGIAANVPGETSTIGTINQLYIDSVSSDTSLVVGKGVTWTTFNKTGGDATVLSVGTTFTHAAGTATIVAVGGTLGTLLVAGGDVVSHGSFAITACTVIGGTFTSNSTGAITTCAWQGGTLDFTASRAPRTVVALQTLATLAHYGPATLLIDDSVITVTGKYEPQSRVQVATA